MSDQEKDSHFERLFEQLAEGALQSREEAEEILQERGRDPKEVAREGMAFVRKMQGKARLQLAQKEKEDIDKMRDQLASSLKVSHENPKEVLAGIMAEQDPGDFEFHFRKIESLDERDAIDMLNDIQLNRLLKRLKGEKGKPDKPDADSLSDG